LLLRMTAAHMPVLAALRIAASSAAQATTGPNPIRPSAHPPIHIEQRIPRPDLQAGGVGIQNPVPDPVNNPRQPQQPVGSAAAKLRLQQQINLEESVFWRGTGALQCLRSYLSHLIHRHDHSKIL
jgi:hypothetical protein